MKLLMLNNFFPSHFGGIEVVASNLAAEISRCGVEVTWIATDTTPPPTDDEASCRVVAVSSNNFLEHRTGIPWPIPTIPQLGEFGTKSATQMSCSSMMFYIL